MKKQITINIEDNALTEKGSLEVGKMVREGIAESIEDLNLKLNKNGIHVEFEVSLLEKPTIKSTLSLQELISWAKHGVESHTISSEMNGGMSDEEEKEIEDMVKEWDKAM